MGILINLRKFILWGRETSKLRPSLGQYALDYEPYADDPNVERAWDVLQRMLGPEHLDAGLNGLLVFIQRNREEPFARVCFSANCEVGFEVIEGRLCIDPHENGRRICCSPEQMECAIEEMLASYDNQYMQ